MNRSNVGNVVTNGMQILSVGATTASKVFGLGKADKSLNALTPEQEEMNKIKMDYLKSKTDLNNTKVKLNENKLKKSETTVDDLMNDKPVTYINNSEQVQEIERKIKNDSEYLKRRNLKNGKNGRFERIEDIIKKESK